MNSGLGVVEEQGSISEGQMQVDGPEDSSDPGRRGAETIEGGATSARKALAADLTFEPLDAIGTAFALFDQRRTAPNVESVLPK